MGSLARSLLALGKNQNRRRFPARSRINCFREGSRRRPSSEPARNTSIAGWRSEAMSNVRRVHMEVFPSVIERRWGSSATKKLANGDISHGDVLVSDNERALPPGQSNLINHEPDCATSDQPCPNTRLSRVLRQQRPGAGQRLGLSACFWPCHQ
jgi:hypothetical protein